GRLSLDRRGRLDAIAACWRSGSTPLPVGAGRLGTDAVLRGSSRRVAESLACVPRSGRDGSGGPRRDARLPAGGATLHGLYVERPGPPLDRVARRPPGERQRLDRGRPPT